jgi:hypothetical protein
MENLLSDRLLGHAELADTLKLLKGAIGGTLAPAVRMAGFNFSSGTEF